MMLVARPMPYIGAAVMPRNWGLTKIEAESAAPGATAVQSLPSAARESARPYRVGSIHADDPAWCGEADRSCE